MSYSIINIFKMPICHIHCSGIQFDLKLEIKN
jgi:hypothetical protein